MNSYNLEYIESLYALYKKSPESVQTEWKYFFDGLEFGSTSEGAFGLSEKELDVYNLIHAYRSYGHLEADLDPLSNTAAPSDQLRLTKFNLNEKDLEQKFQICQLVGKSGATLKELIAYLRSVYCGKLTIQCGDALPEIKNWFVKEFETNPTGFKLDASQKKEALLSLTRAETLEKFIHTRYVGTKRFSIEGGDITIPMLDYIVDVANKNKIDEICLGMAHRGRINVLANFMEKNVSMIFADFNGPTQMEAPLEDFDGDVKYHLGYNKIKKTASGQVECHLAFNPSHLEAVAPVVLGQTRALQRKRKDTQERKKVLPIIIHGDAAFAGQGIVMEVFQMAHVRGYSVGGTIHFVIDNQVGFTTNPENGRSSHYASDAAKITDVPVIHCNGDDAEACIRATDIAVRYRQEWGRDVVINVLCYRRYGHNEGDEPAYTQPLMYDIIRKHQTTREIYSKQVVASGVVDQTLADSMVTDRMNELQKIYDEAKINAPKAPVFKFEKNWAGLKKG
ncbi:MAG: 2-oxoglutarate dehydrogenase subunit E1, partial [Moraxellaceae bacterium]|nr:2-oxoglutarate dehydrogenase subunit E1 [Pseudobdellovibrionaceae bacterium]